ncbi:Di-sulfide bridge nucleocytoplasmic transport domain-containing protein [Melampsora americana]|nr:Di-sulfide bridge nucleocytoplasmic transport domain-containing protein [Melampsora americana]
MHPFRPPSSKSHNTLSRSKESPMDFTYETPPTSTFAESKPPVIIKPLNVIDSNPRKSTTTWFGRTSVAMKEEPQRKRAHYEDENMDWEASPNEIKNSPKPNLFSSLVTKPSEPNGGKFLFNPPDGLIFPPNPTKISSPTKLQPESFGLKNRMRSNVETDPDTSLDSIPSPSPSKLYSHNGVKHEERRRRQRNLRSKLNQMSVESDEDSLNQDTEDDQIDDRPSSRSLIRRGRSCSPSKSSRSTTHNHLTIHGWNSNSESNKNGPKSQLATETPYILLVYLQLLFNTSLVLLAFFLFVNFILMMRTDINSRLAAQTTQLRQEIQICTDEYNNNRCFPISQRTKFIEQHCIEWERCMNQNPSLLSKSKIGAETFAEVMNGFVDVISWKTMIFILSLIAAGIYATNLAMNSYKAKWNPDQFHSFIPPSRSRSTHSTPLGWGTEKEFDPATIFGTSDHDTKPISNVSRPSDPYKRLS